MINFEKAKILASLKLEEIAKISNSNLTFLNQDTITFEFGWVFFYQSEEFVRFGKLEKMIGGNAPILVDKFDGTIYLTGTRKDIHEYVEIFSTFKKAWFS